MSATNVVIFERDGAIGARLGGWIGGLRARLRETRRREGFQRALAAGPFPIAVVALDRDLAPDEVYELLLDARRAGATAVMAADAWSDAESMEYRELGAIALLPRNLSRDKWRALVSRMIDQCQQKTSTTG